MKNFKFNYIKTISSPIGFITVTADDNAITSLTMSDNASIDGDSSNHLLEEAEKQLREYFNGDRKVFSLPISPIGTEFQRKVWSGLTDIPYGQVISYKELAENIGSPKGFRAVGNANGKNPISIIIP